MTWNQFKKNNRLLTKYTDIVLKGNSYKFTISVVVSFIAANTFTRNKHFHRQIRVSCFRRKMWKNNASDIPRTKRHLTDKPHSIPKIIKKKQWTNM